MMQPHDTDYKRLFLAIFLAAIVLIGWQALIEWPRRQQLAQVVKYEAKQEDRRKEEFTKIVTAKEVSAEENPLLSRSERLALSPRIAIGSDKLHGSLALKGARFDDLTLANYRETIDPGSKEVTLFTPSGQEQAYFAQVGWLSGDSKTKVPDANSLWQADQKSLSPERPVNLRWNNGEGVTFVLTVALDTDYMFTIGQRVENDSGAPVSVAPYAYINRAHEETASNNVILHEGPLGVAENALTEIGYKDLRDKGNKTFENATGWFGITDKYWLSAIIPSQGGYKNTFSHYLKDKQNRYQADYLAPSVTVAPGAEVQQSVRLFAGAKEIKVLDRYADGGKQPPIPLFDRSVDFGSLYFMTKPMFLMLNFFYTHAGNFGIAIMLLTIVIKLLMYPLANKSYHSMAQMREVQPQMLKIRERYADDQIALNKEMLALYKREKVNPAAGCLPILIQMPVFFALYKVLYVTIEMRHAPFFGWLRDLSAADSSNIFTAFGLIPWNAPHWLHIGVLPMLFCLTMIIQMRQQPKPADPVQAKMMQFMPFFFLYLFASFPAGLVVYWVWSNILSIIQQQVISNQHKKRKDKAKAKA